MTPPLLEREIVTVLTPEKAAAELVLAQRRVHARLDELARVIGRDEVAELDDRICDVEAAYQGVVTARLLACVSAVNDAAFTAYTAPGGVK